MQLSCYGLKNLTLNFIKKTVISFFFKKSTFLNKFADKTLPEFGSSILLSFRQIVIAVRDDVLYIFAAHWQIIEILDLLEIVLNRITPRLFYYSRARAHFFANSISWYGTFLSQGGSIHSPEKLSRADRKRRDSRSRIRFRSCSLKIISGIIDSFGNVMK